jgi:hypothetical protein
MKPLHNETPRSKLRGIKAKFRRSQKPAFALTKFGAVRLAFAQRRRLRRVSSLQQVADAPFQPSQPLWRSRQLGRRCAAGYSGEGE